MESSSVIGDKLMFFFLDFGVTNEDLLGVLVFEDGVGGSEFTFVGVWLTKMESGAGSISVSMSLGLGCFLPDFLSIFFNF